MLFFEDKEMDSGRSYLIALNKYLVCVGTQIQFLGLNGLKPFNSVVFLFLLMTVNLFSVNTADDFCPSTTVFLSELGREEFSLEKNYVWVDVCNLEMTPEIVLLPYCTFQWTFSVLSHTLCHDGFI